MFISAGLPLRSLRRPNASFTGLLSKCHLSGSLSYPPSGSRSYFLSASPFDKNSPSEEDPEYPLYRRDRGDGKKQQSITDDDDWPWLISPMNSGGQNAGLSQQPAGTSHGGVLRFKITQSPQFSGIRSTRGTREWNEDRYQRSTIRLGGQEVVYVAVFDGYDFP